MESRCFKEDEQQNRVEDEVDSEKDSLALEGTTSSNGGSCQRCTAAHTPVKRGSVGYLRALLISNVAGLPSRSEERLLAVYSEVQHGLSEYSGRNPARQLRITASTRQGMPEWGLRKLWMVPFYGYSHLHNRRPGVPRRKSGKGLDKSRSGPSDATRNLFRASLETNQ